MENDIKKEYMRGSDHLGIATKHIFCNTSSEMVTLYVSDKFSNGTKVKDIQ